MSMNKQLWRNAISDRNFNEMEKLRDGGMDHLSDSDIAFLYKRAMCAGSLPIVKFLIESGYSLSARGDDGLCAMDYAEQLGTAWIKDYLENGSPVL